MTRLSKLRTCIFHTNLAVNDKAFQVVYQQIFHTISDNIFFSMVTDFDYLEERLPVLDLSQLKVILFCYRIVYVYKNQLNVYREIVMFYFPS